MESASSYLQKLISHYFKQLSITDADKLEPFISAQDEVVCREGKKKKGKKGI